jgi:hypothetical protein
MDDKKQNTAHTSGGISKNTLYLIGVVVLVLGLFLAFNVNAALSQSRPQQTPVTYASQPTSGVQSSGSGGVIPSQVGGCG